MTHIEKAVSDPLQRSKWKVEARRIATHLKAMKDWGGKTRIKAGVAFDDQIVTIELEVELIARLSIDGLAETIFDGVLAIQDAAQAPGAVEPGNGRDTERPAPAPDTTPAAAPDRCLRRTAPAFQAQCESPAAGGIRLNLFPHERFQKRYGKRPLVQLILHLPVCEACFALMTPAEVIAHGMEPGQWGAASKEAQRRNQGILPIKEESQIEFIPWADPEYVALRGHIAKHHPEVLNQAPAGPQPEGVGDGS